MHLAGLRQQRIANKVELTHHVPLRRAFRSSWKEVSAVGKHRKSIVRQAIERLDAKMAIGQSRREAKDAIRRARGSSWSVSTGKIHSFKTRSVYQEHAIRFIKWARETHHAMSLVQVDPRADELVAEYLQLHISEGKSPYTLQTERAALRLFFDNRQLAESVPLPRRTRATITRSRGAKAHDRHFQSTNWEPLLRFLQATGLRRQELRDLTCRDIYRGRDGILYVHVESGKGGRQREVEVLAEQEGDVLPLTEGREPKARVFERIPNHLDVHSYRRLFAQARYLHHAPGRSLPPSTGRLSVFDYDRDAALKVTEALGHNRLEVVLRHYLR